MIKSRFEWTVLFVVLLLLGVAWITYSQEAPTQELLGAELTEAPIAGYRAPEFTLSTTTGEEISLSELRGRPVVLNFWATWCPPCRAEMPHFQSASSKYNGQAAVIGVDQGEPLSLVRDFSAGLAITYPLLLDSDNRVSKTYSVTALPTTFFIDADGVIREVFTGIINQAVLEDRIEQLLAEG